MSASYKLALLASIVLCASIIGYYVLQDDESGGAVDADPPRLARHNGDEGGASRAEAPAGTRRPEAGEGGEDAPDAERPRLGDRDGVRSAPSRDAPTRRSPAQARQPEPAGSPEAGETADDFMAELRRRQAAARDEAADPAEGSAPPPDEAEPAEVPAPAEVEAVEASDPATASDTAPVPSPDALAAEEALASELRESDEPETEAVSGEQAEQTAQAQAEAAPAEATRIEGDDEAEAEAVAIGPAEPAADDSADAADAAITSASRSVPETYVIEPGDTFSSLAERFYGDEKRWRDISQANPTIDPATLRPGQEIRLPGVAELPEREGDELAQLPNPDSGGQFGAASDTAQADGEPLDVHVVRQRDTLSRIAEQYYGSPGQWRVIYEANRQAIGDDPGRIREGLELTIPQPPSDAD